MSAPRSWLDSFVANVTGTGPIQVDGGGVVSIDASTQNAAGSMSAADKLKLDYVAIPANITTTNATPTVLQQYNIPDDSIVRLRVTVNAKQRSADIAASYVLSCAYKRHSAGAPAEVGTGSIDSFEDTGAAAWDVSYEVSSNTVQFKFTGAAATTIDVTSKLDVIVTP